MERIFVRLINMSISAGLLILAVIFLRFVLKKAPKRLICLLWGIVAVQLTIPIKLSSGFSVHQITAPHISADGNVEYVRYSETPEKPRIIFDTRNSPYQNIPEAERTASVLPQEAVSEKDLYLPPFMEIWLSGMLLLLAYAGYGSSKLKRLLREAVPCRDNILMGDAVASPFIFGILRPRIYLPSCMQTNQLEYVIAHEQAHLERGDYLWKPLGYLILSIHWFNPVCWIAYLLFCRDIEYACDEKVIQDRNLAWKKEYSAVLLDNSIHGKIVFSCPLAFGEVGVEQRIKKILNYKKPALRTGVAAVVVCVVVMAVFLTVPKDRTYAAPPAEPVTTKEPDAAPTTFPDEDTAQDLPDSAPTNHTLSLYDAPKEDAVCIRVQPSALRERLNYYYIPEGQEQQKLSDLVSGLDEIWERDNLLWQSLKEAGWNLYYQGTVYRVFEGGYFYRNGGLAGENLTEYLKQDRELYDFVNHMLEPIGYTPVDITQIRNIVSATLQIKGRRTNGEVKTYTLTDPSLLSDFEKWFSEAEYILGGADCVNQDACLTLRLENGEEIALSLATDSCTNFGVNGVYYDYRPKNYQSTEGWSSDTLFRCFDESLIEGE